MKIYVCILSVIPVRKTPDDTSEIVTQLLFGEYLEVIDKKNQWSFIRCYHDGYEGWVDGKQIVQVEESTWERLKQLPSERLSITSLPIVTPDGSVMEILKGAELNGLLHESKWSHHYKIFNDNNKLPHITETAYSYLNAPYLWGGRSPFGIDCSGFTQLVASYYQVKLPRDAKDQEKQGRKMLPDQWAEGDYAFFINEKGNVHHVGILLEKDKIIHASGKVRIDSFTTEGIVHVDSGELTHRLYSVKRID